MRARSLAAIVLAVAGSVGCRDEPGAASAPSAAGLRSAVPVRYEDPVLEVRADDPALVAARARARSEIDAVVARHVVSPLTELSVKAPVTDGIHVEHVWLAGVRYEGGDFIGTIDNDLTRVKSRRAGDTVRVNKADVDDYMYEDGGKIRGNYTLRALLDRLPPEDAAKYREMLAPEPEG
jgi:uncharacterized protein YegJ (DUF2314 family)